MAATSYLTSSCSSSHHSNAVSQNGIGADISANVTEHVFDYLDAPVHRVTGVDVPMPYAEDLEKAAVPCVDDIVKAVKDVTFRSV